MTSGRTGVIVHTTVGLGGLMSHGGIMTTGVRLIPTRIGHQCVMDVGMTGTNLVEIKPEDITDEMAVITLGRALRDT